MFLHKLLIFDTRYLVCDYSYVSYNDGYMITLAWEWDYIIKMFFITRAEYWNNGYKTIRYMPFLLGQQITQHQEKKVMTTPHWHPLSPISIGERRSSRCGITGSCCCKLACRWLRPYGRSFLTWAAKQPYLGLLCLLPLTEEGARKDAPNIDCFITTWPVLPVYRAKRVTLMVDETKRNFTRSS